MFKVWLQLYYDDPHRKCGKPASKDFLSEREFLIWLGDQNEHPFLHYEKILSWSLPDTSIEV